MKHILERVAIIAALVATGSGVALAQMHAPTANPSPPAQKSPNAAGMMQKGGMMTKMMSNDPVGACAAMMDAMAKDPVLRKRMNQIIQQMQSKTHGNQMRGPMPTPSAMPY